MPRLLAFLALMAWGLPLAAQPPRAVLSAAQVQQFETAVKANPQDRAARRALLDYYYLARVDPTVAIPARRRHILWLIENAPGDPLAGGPPATIDATGHYLADPQGFKLASAAWKVQIAKPDISAAALVNAAYFFKFSDDLAIQLLEEAVNLEPTNKEFAARLGDEYALVIMGVTMINRNGYPLRTDPKLTESGTAKRAREVLKTSRNPYVLAKAGYQMTWQGAVLFYSKKLAFDPWPIAKSALERAVSLAPGEPDVAALLEEYHKAERERQRLLGTAPGPQKPQAESVIAASRPAPPGQAATDLKKVTVGMSREELLKLGAPAGRITLPDDGHLIEIYQYTANGNMLGTVRLTDGSVTNVQMQ